MAIDNKKLEEMDKITGLSASKIAEMDKIVEKQPTKGNFVGDLFQGLVHGATSLPTALGANLGNTIRPIFGKEKLTQEELKDFNYTGNNKVASLLAPVYSYTTKKPTSNIGKVGSFVGNTAPYLLLPEVKALQGAGIGTKIGNAALTGSYQGALAGAEESIKNKGFTPDIVKDSALGSLYGTAFGAAIPSVQYGLGKGFEKIANSKFTKEQLPKAIEFLTSVPEEYTQRAINKELSGNTIFKGKFNKKDVNLNYKDAGKKAMKGLEEAEIKANKAINKERRNLNNLENIDREALTNEIINNIDEFQAGGSRNAALDEKGNTIYEYLNEILTDKYNSDLAATKGKIQNLISSKYDKETGEGVRALKDMGHTIRDVLNNLSPSYAKANAEREALHELKSTLGVNKKTIASRLRNAEGDAAIRSGYNEAIEELNNIVSPQYKFLDEVKDLRAREALENWLPGQGQGAGSAQGAANINRAAVNSVILNQFLNNLGKVGAGISAMGTFGLTSPKWMGQGTVKNIAKLSKLGNKLQTNAYDEAIRRIVPIGTKTGTIAITAEE